MQESPGLENFCPPPPVPVIHVHLVQADYNAGILQAVVQHGYQSCGIQNRCQRSMNVNSSWHLETILHSSFHSPAKGRSWSHFRTEKKQGDMKEKKCKEIRNE
jgi:hypothetical protein